MEPRYRLRFFFDPGSGVCFRSGNDTARDRFGYAIDMAQLPLARETQKQAEDLIAWFDQSLNWEYPPDPGPWSQDERRRFDEAVEQFVDRARIELGAEFEVVNEYTGIQQEIT